MTDSCQIHFIERVCHKKRTFLALFSHKKVFTRNLFFSIFFLIFQLSITCKIGDRFFRKFSQQRLSKKLSIFSTRIWRFLKFPIPCRWYFSENQKSHRQEWRKHLLWESAEGALWEKKKKFANFSATKIKFFLFCFFFEKYV